MYDHGRRPSSSTHAATLSSPHTGRPQFLARDRPAGHIENYTYLVRLAAERLQTLSVSVFGPHIQC